MTDSNNQIVTSITYFKVERTMDWFVQKHIQSAHQIILYTDTISTANHTFHISHVLDISYKPFSNGNGLFYLHTNQGVFTYEVDSDPSTIIQAYRKLRGDFIL